ncbi:glycosyltransferase involved in cell wall biosynthesis [Salinibacter ruber]|uniref:Glycosyltransferase involved in cell wall biosynthesis n=1 Tax=Salinibacter ruber TaxID=146919 RepID=A0A9X2PVV0_9BACT|nr:glycosyltransferase family 4 protein [Salinibacter ruber]MCS3677765.1 glycosyltransferase involved in cell wall biosynthesis [Salinibacter ruber]MCS3681053.1 glycosyltransferase involved in cell wall biosynthesis [Salinibacter ruber]
MEIAYIVSQYPARSETFIAREVKELLVQGNRLLIAPLRWSDTGEGIRVEGADVLGLQWNPFDWVLSLAWAATRRPRQVLQMGRDICTAPLFSGLWRRLLVLSLVSLALARELDDRSVDHLRAHFLDSEAIAAFWVSRLLGIPFSITVHTLSTRFPTPLLRHVAQATSFCAVSGNGTKRMMKGMANRQNRVGLIRNGVSLPSTVRSRAFPLVAPVWRLLAVGRLVEKKGFDTLLDACALLRDWGRPFRCDIIGDGPCRDRLTEHARRLRIERHVTFCGAQPNHEVYRALRQHDVLVAPCRLASDGDRDGLPTVLMEALSCGVPVVASAFAAIPELVTDGETGRLVPPNAPVALARTLRRLFDQPRHAFRMGREGREQVRRRFRLEQEVETLDARIRTPPRASTFGDFREQAYALD